jgi:hypothetical protein
MSETTAEYRTSKDESNFEKYIELEFVKRIHERLTPFIEKYCEEAKADDSYTYKENRYIELERFNLELARFALDFLAVQKGIPIAHPKPVTQKDLEESLKDLEESLKISLRDKG